MRDEEIQEKADEALQASKKGNHEKCTTLAQCLALGGDPKWMYILALKYRDGVCIPESPRHAEFWLRMSAESGYVKAIIALAELKSFFGPLDCFHKESEQILTKAVNLNHITQEVKDENLDLIIKRNDKAIWKSTKKYPTKKMVYDFPAGAVV
jgi:TPR repeat protein